METSRGVRRCQEAAHHRASRRHQCRSHVLDRLRPPSLFLALRVAISGSVGVATKDLRHKISHRDVLTELPFEAVPGAAVGGILRTSPRREEATAETPVSMKPTC